MFYVSDINSFFSLSCSYLVKGIVEKLEVINKKWVRVKLMPGNAVEGAVSVHIKPSFIYFFLHPIITFHKN